MHDLIGKVIASRYRIESVLGAGGIGTVYRAIQDPLDRPVALKMLHPEFSQKPDLRRRFVREARAVAALAHPNIAMVHDFGIDQNSALYMAMELVDGLSLSELLLAEPLKFEQLAVIFDQILTGLGHAHARGVVHRDIKPANILVARHEDGTPQVKIVDFGIAAVTGFAWSGDEQPTTGTGQVVGTPQYMAPEQARGERHVTASVDVYTVGLLLYWALTGQHAFDGDNPMDVLVAQVSDAPPPLVPRPELAVPDAVHQLVIDALRKSPRDRLPSVAAFRARLTDIIGRTQAPTLSARTEPKVRRTRTTRGRTVVEHDPPTVPEGPAAELFDSGQVGGLDTEDRLAPGAPAVRPNIPLVGREDDRRRLVEAISTARDGGGGLVVTVEGEPGMGKSRIAAWLRQHLQEHEQYRTGHGAFHRDGERGLRGIREAFDDLLGTRGFDTARLAAHVVERLVDWGVPEPSDARTLIRFLRPTSEQTGSIHSGPMPDAINDLLLRVLAHAATDTPVVLTIDDLQWAGREALSFIEFAAAELAHRDARLVIVATVQIGDITGDEIDQMLRQLSRFQGRSVLRHQLGPVGEEDAHRLIHALIHPSPELEKALIARAGGNPMHIVQLVRYLTEERLLEAADEGWRARPGVDVGALLPPSLADLIELRIDQLEQISPGSRLKDLLNRAAVLGRSFRFDVLERMLQIENRADLLEAIDQDVDQLLDQELLRLTETRHDDVLAFPNSLIRDVLVERMRNRRMTRRLHAFAAEAKLTVLGQNADQLADELVVHFRAARDLARELKYGQLAATRAERSHRPHEAVTLLRRALELVDELDEPEDAGPTRRRLSLRIAALLVGVGAYGEADAYFRTVEEDAETDPRESTLAVFGRAKIARILGNFDEAEARYVSGTGQAFELDDHELVARGKIGLARVAWHRGENERASELAEQALDYAVRGEVEAQVPEAEWLLADLARSRGDLDEAEDLFQAAFERFDAQDDALGIAKCLAMLAVVARSLGELSRAESRYHRAQKIYAEHGDRKGVAHQLNGLGDVARFRGDYEAAATSYRRAVDIFQSLRLPYDAALALTNLGLVARDSGQSFEAEDAFRRALVVSERVGFAYLTIGVGLNLAHVLALQGRDQESDQVLVQALELADEADLVDPDYAAPLEALGDLRAASGRHRESAVLLQRARDMWSELGRESDIRRVDERIRGAVLDD